MDMIEIKLPSGESAYPMKNKVPYTWNWDTKGVPDGAHELRATVCDKENNCVSTQIGVTVANAS